MLLASIGNNQPLIGVVLAPFLAGGATSGGAGVGPGAVSMTGEGDVNAERKNGGRQKFFV